MTRARDEIIENVANLLTTDRGDDYSRLIQHNMLEGSRNTEGFISDVLPAIVDEAITTLLQLIDRNALIDRKIDILFSSDLGEDLSKESLYNSTGSLGFDYIDDWRQKSKYKVINP